MKQNNWQLSIIFKFFILLGCLTQFQNLVTLTFKQQEHNSPSARHHRPDSFARIHNRCHNLQELQLVTELASLHALQVPLNPEFAEQNLIVNLPTNNSNKFSSSINSANNTSSTTDNLQVYLTSYNPFVSGDLSETFYSTYAYLSSHYRITQEAKYPYLAKQRHAREQQTSLASQDRAQARKQVIALELVRDYNRRPNNLNLPEQFCSAKFNNSEQQNLHNQQIEIVCELANTDIFPKKTVGLRDFSDTVIETISLAYRANRKELIALSRDFTELAQDFLALGQGLARGGYNFVSNITNAGTNLIIHPFKASKAITANIANLTKNVTFSLIKVAVLLLNFEPECLEFKFYTSALYDYGSEPYQQFWHYVATVPRTQKFEQVGEFVGEQTLSLAANFLTGKVVSLVSDSVIAVQLHGAVTVKKKADKAKPEKISWLNKFGAPGKDVTRTLGLVVTEEYELATLDGLVVSFKNSPVDNQTLFNHAEEYLKHNKSGNKTKHKSVIKVASDEIKPARIMGSQITPQEKIFLVNQAIKEHGFRKTNYYSNGQQVLQKGNKFITIDIDSHNGGIWKMADSVKKLEHRTTRLGTYDQNLNRIGD